MISTDSKPRPHNWTATEPASAVLQSLMIDWWAPLYPGANVLLGTDGRAYIHEFRRWGVDPVVREVPALTVDFPLLQDWPDPESGPDCPATAAGTIEVSR